MLQKQNIVNENCCFLYSGAFLSFWTNLYVCFFVRIMFVLLCKITGLATCIENVYMFVNKNTGQDRVHLLRQRIWTGAAAARVHAIIFPSFHQCKQRCKNLSATLDDG